jgi:hypothetical protein
MCPCQRLDIAINAALLRPPKQLCCFALPLMCGNGAGGANYLEKQGVYFFLKMELIRLYVRYIKRLSLMALAAVVSVTY